MAKAYEKYLQTLHWKSTRLKKLMRAELLENPRAVKCERCGFYYPLIWKRNDRERIPRFLKIQIHHRTYERIGCERMDDLEVLCEACHAMEHGLQAPAWFQLAYKDWSGRAPHSPFVVTVEFMRECRNLVTIGEVMSECLAELADRDFNGLAL